MNTIKVTESVVKEEKNVIKDIQKEIEDEMREDSNDRGVLDILTEKLISRKLLVWIVCSVFLLAGKLSPDEWVAISLGYIGVEGIADIAVKWKGARQ